MLTTKELDAAECYCGTCDAQGILYFHACCHPQSPTWVAYHKDGFLIVSCAECGEELAQIAVKEG
jgi:hypothetical protein